MAGSAHLAKAATETDPCARWFQLPTHSATAVVRSKNPVFRPWHRECISTRNDDQKRSESQTPGHGLSQLPQENDQESNDQTWSNVLTEKARSALDAKVTTPRHASEETGK
jgi:hypothetical protein